MKSYTITIDDAIADFIEAAAHIAERPVEDIIIDTLYYQLDVIKADVYGNAPLHSGRRQSKGRGSSAPFQ